MDLSQQFQDFLIQINERWRYLCMGYVFLLRKGCIVFIVHTRYMWRMEALI